MKAGRGERSTAYARRVNQKMAAYHDRLPPTQEQRDTAAIGRARYRRQQMERKKALVLQTADEPPRPQFRAHGDHKRQASQGISLPKFNLPPLSQED